MQVAVIGAGECEEETRLLAREVGRRIAEAGHVLISGGLGGVMEAASQGAREAGGLTVGVLPGVRGSQNSYVDVAIATGMSHARNAIVVRSADAAIALPGSYGTLSEIALALKMGRRVVDLGGWDVDGMVKAGSAEEAVRMVGYKEEYV
ncbi:MAG: TIGR00725 family protein [Euryarchaeota archaeon]|nr:TIGR00725 family protein [Euryarchaeota archaeon]